MAKFKVVNSGNFDHLEEDCEVVILFYLSAFCDKNLVFLKKIDYSVHTGEYLIVITFFLICGI